MDADTVLETITLEDDSKLKWEWDSKDIGKDISLGDKNLEIVKASGNAWSCGFGCKVLEKKGIYRWRIKCNKYPSGDKSGIMYGICEESAKSGLINYGRDVLNKSTVYGIGGSGNLYNMVRKEANTFKEGCVIDFELDLKEGKFTIEIDGKEIATKSGGLKDKKLLPLLSIYYKDTKCTLSKGIRKKKKK